MAEPPLRSLKGIIHLPKLQGCNGAIITVDGYMITSNYPQDCYRQDDYRKSHLLRKRNVPSDYLKFF